jgi:hypothetical protein
MNFKRADRVAELIRADMSEIIRKEVKVNGEVDLRRGKKLVKGDVVEYDGKSLKIE